MRSLVTVMLALSLVLTGAGPANAVVGTCSSNTQTYISSICYFKDTQFSGAYGEWPSVALNISSSSAASKHFIAEILLLRDRQSLPGAQSTFLEVGDTAGGGNIVGHVGEWGRMWYWVDGTQGYSENFIQYAPNGGTGDGVNRSWRMEFDNQLTAWVISIGGQPKITVTTWRHPSTTADMKIFTALEVGGGVLDGNRNSGLFTNQSQQWRDLNSLWHVWDARWEQLDSPCGTAPTCLQGWWTGLWNNAKPGQ